MLKLAGFIVPALLACALSAQVTISNSNPKRDSTGAIMDAHDGKILHVAGLYYWFAASYGNCTEPKGNSGCAGAAPGACGFQLNHNVTLWTSTDLFNWQYQGVVFGMANSGLPAGAMFCPKVLYNKQTGMWVLWVNPILGDDFGVSYYAVATSAQPTGPFKVVSQNVTSLAFQDVGDFNLFQDDDGTAYVIYTSHIQGYPTTHQMSVEKLTSDYTATLGSAGNSGFFGQSFVEAPAYFKRNGVYYAVFGQCCCYCQSGSPVTVYSAPSPMGPYTAQGKIDVPGPMTHTSVLSTLRKATCPAENRGRAAAFVQAVLDGAPVAASAQTACKRMTGGDSAVHAQQTDIFAYTDGQGQQQFIWVGDRWQQSPDGLKSHDPTYWAPLVFNSTGGVQPFTFVDNFTITVTA